MGPETEVHENATGFLEGDACQSDLLAWVVHDHATTHDVAFSVREEVEPFDTTYWLSLAGTVWQEEEEDECYKDREATINDEEPL